MPSTVLISSDGSYTSHINLRLRIVNVEHGRSAQTRWEVTKKGRWEERREQTTKKTGGERANRRTRGAKRGVDRRGRTAPIERFSNKRMHSARAASRSFHSMSSTMPCFFLPAESLSSPSLKVSRVTTVSALSILASFSLAPPPLIRRRTSDLLLANSSETNRSITGTPSPISAALTWIRGRASVSAVLPPPKSAAAVAWICSMHSSP
mmetsp:Transcript_36821/g.77592  ORF Transcript_36821/g.77592 Transcript_36821/m.77592 type:complete len:208 (-) Transcript_36821:1285-1908(-)